MDAQGLKTLEWGARLAEEFQAHLSLLHVIPEAGADVHVRNALAEMQRQAGTKASVLLEQGDIPDHVESIATRKHADLVLIGRSSDAGVFGRLRKNSYAIIRQTPCPVISV
jgi:nucleotide-binding universal stress UspA family protein